MTTMSSSASTARQGEQDGHQLQQRNRVTCFSDVWKQGDKFDFEEIGSSQKRDETTLCINDGQFPLFRVAENVVGI